MMTTRKPGRTGWRRLLWPLGAGLVLAVALAGNVGADSSRGHARHERASQGRERHSYQEPRRAFTDRRGPVYSHSRRFFVSRRPTYLAPRPIWWSRSHRVMDRPWWAGAPRVEIESRPYYLDAAFGFYVDGMAVQFDLGDAPPDGYVWYDPYCHEEFSSIAGYREHCDRYDHPRALSVAYVTTGRDGERWER